jgi:hypothetical protein
MSINVRHERMTEGDCRNAAESAANGGYAGIYNAEGYGIANIDRLARIDGGGDLGFVHDHVSCNDDPKAHATTDEQWKSLIRLLNAAPKMLQIIREYRHEAREAGWGCDSLDAMATEVIDAVDGRTAMPADTRGD